MNRKAAAAVASVAVLIVISSPVRGLSQEVRRDIRSDEAMRMAFEHNPDFRAALLDEEQAAVAVRAETGLYPLMLQLDGGFTHSSSPSVANDGSIDHRSSDTTVLGAELSKTLPIGTQTSFRVEGNQQLPGAGGAGNAGPGYGLAARLALTQPILRGAGKSVVEASWRQALRSQEMTALRARRIASETARDVLDTYWELWYAQMALEIEIRARDLARTQLEDVDARVAEGDLASVDALPFQTRLSTLEESIVSARANRDNLSVRLAGLIGFSSGSTHVTADTSDLPPMETVDPDVDEAIRTALANSPAIREQLASIALAEERATTAGEQLRPRLDLMGWLEANTLGNGEVSPAFSQYGDGEAYSAYVGLVYELPLDDTRKDAQRASAQLDVDIAGQQLLATRDSVKAEILTVAEGISSARMRLDLAERTLEVARRQAEAERERYNLGAGIFVQVREAEESVRQADLRTVRARVDLVQARLELDHLTGKLLEKYGDLARTRPTAD